jgi:hypothetical protein
VLDPGARSLSRCRASYADFGQRWWCRGDWQTSLRSWLGYVSWKRLVRVKSFPYFMAWRPRFTNVGAIALRLAQRSGFAST